MTKTLLILAASTYQVPTIKAAVKLGWRVITTDNAPDNPGHRLANASYNIDTTDKDGVLAIARHEKITAVMAPATDIAVTTASYVSQKLGLPGPLEASARLLTHKMLFRSFLKHHDLPYPTFIKVFKSFEPDPELFLTPWVMKPCRSSGSKGVFIIRNKFDFDQFYDLSAVESDSKEVLIEQFLPGTQHTCEGILIAGDIAFHLITDRDTAAFPYTATKGHRVPTLIPESAKKNLLSALNKIFSLLQLTDGPFDCDFVANGNEVTIIELTPRLGGNSLSTLVAEACNLDLVECAINYAGGSMTEWVFSQSMHDAMPLPTAVLILGVERSGQLRFNQEALHRLRSKTWVSTLNLDFKDGDWVTAFKNGRHRVGEALIRGATRKELDQNIRTLYNELELTAQ